MAEQKDIIEEVTQADVATDVAEQSVHSEEQSEPC